MIIPETLYLVVDDIFPNRTFPVIIYRNVFTETGLEWWAPTLMGELGMYCEAINPSAERRMKT